MFNNEPEKYHWNIIRNLSKEECIEINNKNRQIIIDEINNTNCENVIFSGKDISVMSEENVAEFFDFLKKLMPYANLKVVLVTRDINTYIHSIVQQMIKNGIEPYPLNIEPLYKNI